MQRTADIFVDEGRQAIRLPEDIRVSGDHLLVRQDERTGEVILSAPAEAVQNEAFAAFLKLREEIGPADEDFLGHRTGKSTPGRDTF